MYHFITVTFRIDIDWEYPGYEPHSGTPEDGVSWNLLLDDLRVALDELEEETGHYYGITAYVFVLMTVIGILVVMASSAVCSYYLLLLVLYHAVHPSLTIKTLLM